MTRLFWKFFFGFLLALAVASTAVGIAVSVRQAAEIQTLIASPIKSGRFTSMAVSVAAKVGEYDGREGLLKFLKQLHYDTAPTIYVIDANGDELLGRDVTTEQIAYAQQLLFTEIENRSVRQATLAEGDSVLMFVPRLEADKAVAADIAKRKKPPSLSMMIVMGTLSGLIFSGLLAWWFTQPIRHLRKAFNAVASGKLETRVSPAMGGRHDELAELGQKFDQMTVKLQQLITAQQTLLHDVSHELRSPLARMQAAIGIAQQQPNKSAEVMERLERESQRIDLLIGDLLNLSRLETLQQQLTPHQHFDFAELIQLIIEDARFESASKQIEIHYRGLNSQRYEGQPELLHRAIENVLRNAIKFSPDNSQIQVQFNRLAEPAELQICITDQGPGVNEDDLNRIFKAFYRGTSAHREYSSGLGLTIAKRAIEGHQGYITAQNLPAGGLQVDIHLPL